MPPGYEFVYWLYKGSFGPSASVKSTKDVERGIQTLLQELQALDFPRSELRLYFAAAQKLPPRFAEIGVERTAQAMNRAMEGSPTEDPEALEAGQALLSELWSWKRRGGGLSDNTLAVHEAALLELQNQQPEETAERVSSILLDNMPGMTDADKLQLGRGLEQVAFAGVQGFLWNAIGLTVLAVVLLNFLLLNR
ncbi:hypothetical protein WJX72_008142 [[Myrmecia] bisecta]|uniref:Uncharacterized protein n=1 Tax=[Myrmecia] bisecta TaxID=41462 RepID=A0AAW1Q0K2_9CHLO